MSGRISIRVRVANQELATKLDAALSTAGADTSVNLSKHGAWAVFANYEQTDAAHVGRAILKWTLQ